MVSDEDWKLVDQASSLSARAQAILTVRLKDTLEKQTAMLEKHVTALEKQAESSDTLGRRMWWLNVWLLVVAVVGLGLTAVPILIALKRSDEPSFLSSRVWNSAGTGQIS